jgi:hypothetical protein
VRLAIFYHRFCGYMQCIQVRYSNHGKIKNEHCKRGPR